MELSQIKYFLAVADSLSFTKAAESCAVSQPALSKSIRKLEETLGADLLVRSPQKVALTDFGNTMLVHFEKIEDARQKARDVAKAATTYQVQKLNVGVMCTIGPRRFAEFLNYFSRAHPHFELTLHNITSEAISELLLTGALDCVLTASEGKLDNRFETVELYRERMEVAFAEGHPFAKLDTVPLLEIAKEPYLDRLHCEFRNDFMNFTKSSGIDLNVSLSSEREDWILELVNRGLGVSVMPSDSISLSHVDHRPITDHIHTRSLDLVMTSNATISKALTTFRDAAKDFDWDLTR